MTFSVEPLWMPLQPHRKRIRRHFYRLDNAIRSPGSNDHCAGYLDDCLPMKGIYAERLSPKNIPHSCAAHDLYLMEHIRPVVLKGPGP